MSNLFGLHLHLKLPSDAFKINLKKTNSGWQSLCENECKHYFHISLILKNKQGEYHNYNQNFLKMNIDCLNNLLSCKMH